MTAAAHLQMVAQLSARLLKHMNRRSRAIKNCVWRRPKNSKRSGGVCTRDSVAIGWRFLITTSFLISFLSFGKAKILLEHQNPDLGLLGEVWNVSPAIPCIAHLSKILTMIQTTWMLLVDALSCFAAWFQTASFLAFGFYGYA